MPYPTDTIAALATPMGTSAIAVVRASGPAVSELIRGIFGAVPSPRLARHADYRACAGTLIDDVLFTFFAAPRSFTGEDSVEISCHGNPFIAQKILEDLFARGCRPAEAGEFSQRAFLKGRIDLSQAEAIMDLIHARSERALAAANRQLRGALGRQMETLIQQLVSLLATVEAYIDFPEEDLPEENKQTILTQLIRLQQDTGKLLATSHYGAMLREGIKTVIVGEPNAGKSSLLNCMVGRDRALVSPEAGTTRDYLEERVIIGEHGFRLIDTAGLNPAPTALERRGIEKTIEQISEADLFLWVVDVNSPLPQLPAAIRDRLTPWNTILVLNKVDSLKSQEFVNVIFGSVRVSALTGEGLGGLRDKLLGLANTFSKEAGDEGIAINARHAHALTEAKDALASAYSKLAEGSDSELVASDFRAALESFGRIAGKIDNERVLDQLFASFCIGK